MEFQLNLEVSFGEPLPAPLSHPSGPLLAQVDAPRLHEELAIDT